MTSPEAHEHLLADLAARLDDVDELEPAAREVVYGLLDAVDELHRGALRRLGALLDADTLARLRAADPAVCWLLDAYWVGVDPDAVEAALHDLWVDARDRGGHLDILDLDAGVVRLRLRGVGAEAARLRDAVEQALRRHVPGVAGVEVEVDDGPAAPGTTAPEGALAPPDGARLLPLAPRPPTG